MTDDEIMNFVDSYKFSDTASRLHLLDNIKKHYQESNSHLLPVRAIILLRYRNRLDEAEEIASHFLGATPFNSFVAWELGYSFGVSGRPEKAILYIEKAMSIDDTPERRIWLSLQYAMLGRFNEANATLLSINEPDKKTKNEIKIYNEFFDMLRDYDRRGACNLLDTVKGLFACKPVSELEKDISNALVARTPYLLLRLGDGEGAYIRLSETEEQSRANYYRANREEFATIWFKDTSVLDDGEFLNAIGEFNKSIASADAIGGSMYPEAIELEYNYSSRRGIAWVVNTMRKLLALAEDNPEWAKKVPIYHLVIHYDLLLSGALGRILKNRQGVGLISCQDELPSALQRTYGIRNVDFIKVPGEQIHSSTLGDKAVNGKHWPDRYREINELLDKPVDRRGELWLVAAGMLGKIYAAKLKASGAVVLDIGAVADLWMGKMTRTFPNLPEEVTLRKESDVLTLVDVGGLGGLGEEWLPHISRVRAVLFEPNPPEAAIARQKIAASPGGIVIERALSNRAENRTLHVTKSLGCTSLLKPNEDFLKQYSIAPAFEKTDEIQVDCVRFDSLVLNGEVPIPDVIKIDVQGFEYNVLEGFGGVLSQCLGLKAEAHLYPIYNGQKLLHDLVDLLGRAGLMLRRIKPVSHFDGDIVEVDAWFTCSHEKINSLTPEQVSKLSFIEQVWELNPRIKSFSPTQFND
ncbi:FkbM family methyltransferase [Methylobacterium sp. Leaf123]|uniref:FkbM family methyltransferase n=1 Tax=Methylobacterium sp. Leaf123 TaxID=1736264 RepID=UPI0009EBCFC1|nr:FkbM family methyltransferase [Methylobacterium sp. Leaf123]